MAKMKNCPVCGIGVKLENLEKHIKRVHPRANVNAHLTESDKTEIRIAKKRKKTASPFDERERRRWAMAGIVVAAVVAVFVILLAITPPHASDGNIVGNPAPLFVYNDVDNQPYNLNSRIGSRLILLEFFYTQCSWCLELYPNLEELHAFYGNGDQLEIVSISADSRDSFEDVRNFRDLHGAEWTFISAPDSLGDTYGVSVTPMMFLIDYDGTVVEQITGYKTVSAMKSIINEHL